MIDLPLAVLLGFTAAFGLAIGSFLTVVIRRLPLILQCRWLSESKSFTSEAEKLDFDDTTMEKLSLALPPSHCPGCKKKLAIQHKIPLLSYLFLGGKCGYCKVSISRQYPLVELLALLVSLVIVSRAGFGLESLMALIFSWTLIALSFIDINQHLLPDELTFPLLWLGLAVNSYGLFVPPVEAIWGALAGYLTLWITYHGARLATGREGMGYGDMKLLAAAGAWCGWQALPIILLVASVGALLISAGLLLRRKMKRSDPIPFGPYLSVSAWLFFTCIFIYKWSFPLTF